MRTAFPELQQSLSEFKLPAARVAASAGPRRQGASKMQGAAKLQGAGRLPGKLPGKLSGMSHRLRNVAFLIIVCGHHTSLHLIFMRLIK